MSNAARPARRIAAFILALAGVSSGLDAQSLSYIGGFQYATGDFIFTQRTWSAYLSNGLTWSDGRLRATASVPLVFQPAGWVQYGGGGMMIPTGGVARGTTGTGSQNSGMMNGGMNGGSMTPSGDMPFSHIGIGDPVARLDAALLRDDANHSVLSIVGAAKAPLADVSRGFGTGEWDAGAGLASTVMVGGTSIFADAVYWKLGNPPGGAVRDALAYTVSAGKTLNGSRWSVLGTLAGATSLWTGLEGPVQAGVGAGYLLESGSSVFATAALGLTRTAPTLSTGLGWRVPLGVRR